MLTEASPVGLPVGASNVELEDGEEGDVDVSGFEFQRVVNGAVGPLNSVGTLAVLDHSGEG